MTMTANGFEKVLRDVRHGECVTELTEKLAQLVAQVRLAGKGGKLVLELKVAPATRGDGSALVVTDDVKITAPKMERVASVFFSDESGGLHRNDPRQREFELKAVSGGAVDPTALKQAVSQ